MKLPLLFILSFSCAIQIVFGQSLELNADKWARELSDKDYKQNEKLRLLDVELTAADSAKVFQFLNDLTKKGKSKGYHYQARLNCLRARAIYYKKARFSFHEYRKPGSGDPVKDEVMQLFSSAMDFAYRSEDDYLIAFVSYFYGSTVNLFGETGLAVMYAKSGVDLYEKLSYPILPETYQFLAEILYKVREYNECVKYGSKAVSAWQSSRREFTGVTINCINTVALGYHRQGKYDSAFIIYNQALQLAKQINNKVWTGIVSGNEGQIYYAQGKYDSAYSLLKMDYRISKEAGYYDNAANSLQWAARANLARGNKATALAEVRQAFQLLNVWHDAGYLRNAYFTAMQIFREMGVYDSAFYYNNLYSAINDSLEKVVATSSLAISKARLNDETSRYNIQNLNKDKKSQLLLRNIIIAAIVGLSFISLLIVNRKRLKEKMKKEKVEQDKLRMEQEIVSAKEQMKMFTDNIIEKTSLIEKLEDRLHHRDTNVEQVQLVDELSRQTILTEEDWKKFKTLFEKIHPAFFINLKEQVSDITLAEQRMAALTRLHLTTRQIASILGISPNSVNKTKQRLRHRLNLQPEVNIEDIIAKI